MQPLTLDDALGQMNWMRHTPIISSRFVPVHNDGVDLTKDQSVNVDCDLERRGKSFRLSGRTYVEM